MCQIVLNCLLKVVRPSYTNKKAIHISRFQSKYVPILHTGVGGKG